MAEDSGGRRGPALRRLAVVALVLAVVTGLWTLWAESNREEERALRLAVRDALDEWFPEQMKPLDGWHGLHPVHQRDAMAVVLLHGLDEPGPIWDDLKATMADTPWSLWEFRYPNDQAIDRSAAWLADQWAALPEDRPAVLLGHSMGGLVAREFVSAWRHPVAGQSRVAGAPVSALILVGTPNHGSEWARLRIWLELRDQFLGAAQQEFSLFAALRDGTGAAKVDLHPDSEFLARLNARPWPEEVAVHQIAGDLAAPTAPLRESVEALMAAAPGERVREAIGAWWDDLRPNLGDGAVTVDSARLEGFPPPVVLAASHRGLLRHACRADADQSRAQSSAPPGTGGDAECAPAPAIPIILEWLGEISPTPAG